MNCWYSTSRTLYIRVCVCVTLQMAGQPRMGMAPQQSTMFGQPQQQAGMMGQQKPPQQPANDPFGAL